MAEEAPRRRGAPSDRRGREALSPQLGRVALELLERRTRKALAEKGREPAEVAAVRIDRSWRTPRCANAPRDEFLGLLVPLPPPPERASTSGCPLPFYCLPTTGP